MSTVNCFHVENNAVSRLKIKNGDQPAFSVNVIYSKEVDIFYFNQRKSTYITKVL